MKTKVFRNWDPFMFFLVLTVPSLMVDWVVLVLYLPVLVLAGLILRWVHTPLGLFTKTEYANGVATVMDFLNKRTRKVDLNAASYLYTTQTVFKYLVVSEEPLSSKAEAVAAYKAGKANFIIHNVDCDALYPYIQKATPLK